ncbi:SDR family NAD(P)-dependent oxidoreductase [Cognatishimia sp. SS12]|uniref:SDR family oxidoreductase n=1 Tax=Cognatishimia sp. SS12 TaxID=2979465 RepID=UPI002330AF72|nr:SDR family oxidoreductase [Cognatishimia sp. SS12]MDC0739032.1 SDR family NAD(P)-dependent oxidoreductase [Cognatishimia sp. SS12]
MNSIIITGASSGIGRATAQAFLEQGWRVGLVARRGTLLTEMAKRNKNAMALPVDVTDAGAMKAAFDRFVSMSGRLDALFNNAGVTGPSASIDEVPLDDFDHVLNVNVRGMFIAAQLAFAQMRAQSPQGGRIINNGSLAAHSPRPNTVCYTTTKHAITGLTRALSLDGRPYDIACGQIDIGNADTDMVDELNARALAVDPTVELAPTMDVQDVARLVLHMAELPPAANVQFMTVMATKMPFVGRG